MKFIITLRDNVVVEVEKDEKMLRIMQKEAPNIFGDYEITEAGCKTEFRKV